MMIKQLNKQKKGNLMKALKIVLALSLILGLVVISCQDRANITEPQHPGSGIRFSLPSAVPDSAFFIVYVTSPGNSTVTVHRITADWVENTVTWNSFGEQYDATVENSFVPNAVGFYSINVTSLVQGWISGTYPNYGLLLDEVLLPLTAYTTSEWPYTTLYRPMLKLYYGATPDSIQRGVSGTVFDTYIWEAYPDNNYGTVDQAYTGASDNVIKQALFKFDLPTVEMAGIGDFVWFDDNRDGIQDLGEPGVPGVVVNLMDCEGNVLATDTTDADGLYWFGDLNPGDYNIHFVLPDGYMFSPQDQGTDDALDSDADVTTGNTICTTLDAGEMDSTWDAGIYLPDEHCTRTIGYWKTHDGSGPQEDVVTPLLPIWLGTAGGTKSIDVTNTTISHDILSQDVYGTPKNGITKLYAQLLGAKLNAANDADISLIADVIADADAFLAMYDWNDWDSLTKAQKGMVLEWAGTLDDYNNGLIGPIHCD
jgi:hypothetical protein